MQSITQAITASISALALDRILAFLVPLFLDGAHGSLPAARVAAANALQAYAARNEEELRLAAQVIAFSLRALDTLARTAEPGLDLKTILRLNSSAATLHRAAMRCRKELDCLRAQPLAQEEIPTAEPPELPVPAASVPHAAVDTPTPDALEPSGTLAPSGTLEPAVPHTTAPPAPTLSRQQRRLAERLARRESRRQPERLREVERTLRSLQALEAAL